MAEPTPLESLLSAMHSQGMQPIVPGLGNTLRLLEKLGNPHLKLPPIIHVAGTNGKGSTIAFLRAMLEAEGRCVHVYTSPHLVKFNERIVLADKEISDEKLRGYLERVVPLLEENPCTFFESTTALAMLAMSEVPADYVLLEVGMGGRLDSTNVVTPALSIITPIGMDHMEFLGETLAQIAAEKAGIIKAGVPVISAPQKPEAAEVIREIAHQKNAALTLAPSHGERELALAGEHQKINASVAIAAAKQLGVSETAIDAGLKNARWPARLQQLEKGLWLDGGHNADAGKVLAEWVAGKAPLTLILGMVQGKDVAGFLAPLAPYIRECIAVDIEGEPRSMKKEDLAAIAKQLGINARTASLDVAMKAPKPMLICGSLYLAGQVLATRQTLQARGCG